MRASHMPLGVATNFGTGIGHWSPAGLVPRRIADLVPSRLRSSRVGTRQGMMASRFWPSNRENFAQYT